MCKICILIYSLQLHFTNYPLQFHCFNRYEVFESRSTQRKLSHHLCLWECESCKLLAKFCHTQKAQMALAVAVLFRSHFFLCLHIAKKGITVLCVCMNTYNSGIVKAWGTKLKDNMSHYYTQVIVIMEFSHTPLRPRKSKKYKN